MPKIIINESLFAHINNDAFLTGSVSGFGASFQDTVSYLKQYLDSEPELSDNVRHLSHACAQLLAYESQLDAITTKAEAATLANTIQHDIQALPNDQYLLLPGGWAATTGEQHRMVYHIKKDADGNVFFGICNSGEGIIHHAKRSDKDKERYNPLLTYRIPQENLGKKDFAHILEALLLAQTANIPEHRDIRTDELYQSLFPKLAYLKGEIVADDSLPYTSVPLSRTSTQGSLHQLLKAQFSDVDSYRRFIYGFKAKALDEYIAQLRQNHTINDPKHHRLLREALRHQLRLLNVSKANVPEEPLFDAAIKSAEQQKLVGYLQEITAVSRVVVAAITPPSSTIIPTPTPRNLGRTTPYRRVNPAAALPHEEHADPIIPLDVSRSLFEQMDELLQRCNALEEEKQYRTIFNQLEHFFTNLPLPANPQEEGSFYQEISDEEQALAFYEKMNALQKYYFESSQKILNKETTSPRLYVVKLSIQAIGDHISQAYPLTKGEPTPSALLTQNTAYLATHQPKLDKRYKELCELPKRTPSTTLPTNTAYYQSIIDKEPELKEQLEALYATTYANDVTSLHQTIRHNKNTSLFYFTEHYDELSRQDAFHSLTIKFKLQYQKEQLYSFFSYATDGQYQSDIVYIGRVNPLPKIGIKEDPSHAPILNITSTLTHYEYGKLNPSPELTQSVYPINDGTGADTALTPLIHYGYIDPHKTDNQTQLIPTSDAKSRYYEHESHGAWATQAFTALALEDRELSHLRRSSALQIPLTLDYFNRHLEKLSDHNLQQYVEANLFEPGVLLTELEKNPARFFEQFDAFIKNGLAHFERKGELTQHSLFFIRVMYLVNQYAAACDSTRYSERLNSYHALLNRCLFGQTNAAICTSLHQYRFQCLMSKPQSDLSDEDVKEALLSHFRTAAHSNPHHRLSDHSTLHYQDQKQAIISLLKEKIGLITPAIVTDVLRAIDLRLPDPIEIRGTYPRFTVLHQRELLYTVNVEQGLAFKGNAAYHTTPMEIQNHPLTQQFGLQSRYSCFISADESVYVLENEKETLRFIKSVAYEGAQPTYRVQKKWLTLTGDTQWYELVPSSLAQAAYWQVNKDAIATLPKMLSERGQLLWKAENNTYVVSDANNTLSHDITALGVITTRTTQDALCQDDTKLHQRLQSFEAKDFITVWETSTQAHTVRLDRYGLEWHIPAGQQTLHWSYEDADYELIEGGPTIGENIAHLNVQRGDTVLCLLPVQRFLPTQTRAKNNDYFQLRQDTAAHIAEEIIGPDACWKYANTERYLVLKVDKTTGQPTPSTPEEALYLCYLYLGSHQPEKAWAVLEDCDKRLGGLTGSYEELQYVQWIVKALPYPLPNDKATLSNPPYVACQLKALALLTNHSKKIVIPEPTTAANTANGQYERHTRQETSDFYNTINGTLYTLFQTLQSMRRELPAEYELSNAERKSLLNHYHQENPAIGALGHEWVQLHISALQQEAAVWAAKEATHQVLTPYEHQRREEIATFLQKHQGVAKRHSLLEYRPIDLTLPDNITVKTSHLSYHTQQCLRNFQDSIINRPSNTTSQEHAVAALSLTISDDDFIANLKDYLTIIRQSNHPLQETVLNFCKATLISARHVPLEKQIRLLPLLCNILYRAKSNPNAALDYVWSLDNYISRMRSTVPPAITVPQLIDNTQELLTSALTVWEETPAPAAAIPPTRPSPVITERLDDGLRGLQQQWHEIEKRFHLKKASSLVDGVSASNSDDLSDDEWTSGEKKYEALQALQHFANEQLQNPALVEHIRATSATQIDTLKRSQAPLLQELLTLGNTGPDDPTQNQQWHIDIAAGKRKSLSLNHLLTLYFHNDVTRYATETGLAPDKINQLHGKITQYLAHALQQQQCERVQQKLTALQRATEEERPQARFLLAQTLFAENLANVVTEPALSVFQYHENKLLRLSQKEALERLLTRDSTGRFNETVEKMIMGGGKSKILLPMLAEEKASGDNLVIIEVPRALLHTNYVDLKATSATLFNQGCYLFEFDRDSDCSADRLERLYQQLVDVSVNKQYMVTTGESLQSLELKYLELLHTKPSVEGKTPPEATRVYNTWQQQVLAAERLVLLLRRKGDLIIDEVHQGLLLKTKLNYTLGDPRPIPKNILKQSVDLYQFFDKVDISALFPEKGPTFSLYDALLQRVTLTDPGLIQGIMDTLTEELITQEQSPLHQLINALQALEENKDKDISQLIRRYLQNQDAEIPDVILKASGPIREKLAFFKEQITTLLPFTLLRHQGEHYGPSHITSQLPQKRLLAIPYIANNVPNERSRFGNYLESINYTVQSTLLTGIEPDLLRTVLEDWLTEARTEVQKNPEKAIDDTIIAGTFKTILGDASGITLSQLNLDNEEQLSQLYQKLRQDRAFIFEILRTHILPNIKTNDNVLHSDSLSHVDLVHSCQGTTGTPWNYTTFHQRLQLSTASALGTDAYVQKAIQEKNPTIRGIDFKDTTTFINTLLTSDTATTNVRAIIDINATFKGVSNLTVATELTTYLHQHKTRFSTPNALKYVLFFNEQNELSALPIAADTTQKLPIIIGSSDPDVINARLNCTPAERFTYYDQAHTLGTDIKQAPDAKALVLVDNDLSLQHFLQGSMRMRDLLEGRQTIDLIVPKKIQALSLDELSDVMLQNQQEQLQQGNYYAALAKMRNMLRNDFMERLLHITGDDAVLKKHDFLIAVDRYFIETDTTSFFERYGGLSETDNTSTLLENYKNHLLTDWSTLLQRIEQQPTEEARAEMRTQMEAIVTATCRPGVTHPQQMKRKHALATEVEVEQEQQVEVSVLPKKEIPDERYHSDYKPYPYTRWMIDPHGIGHIHLLPLTDLCRTAGAEKTPRFSNNLLASRHFYQTYNGQQKYIDMYLKPVHALLFRIIEGKLQCLLVTQQECNDLCQQMTDDATWWISTTQHTVLAGRPPADIRNDADYQSLIEQVRYFNGEFNLLLTETAPSSWLEEETKLKLDFYRTYLWPYHETPDTDVALLYTAFASRTKALAFISKTPWNDLTSTDWEALFPDSEGEELLDFQNIARAFHYATEHWNTPLNTQELRTTFAIPFYALGHVERYVAQLTTLRTLVESITTTPTTTLLANNDTIIRSLSALCPALIPIFTQANRLSPEEANYELLISLMNHIPMCHHEPLMLQALAKNQYLYQLPQEDSLLYTTDTSALECYDDTLLAVANNGYLPRNRYVIAVQNLQTREPSRIRILSSVLKDKEMPLSLLHNVIKQQTLNETHIDAILTRPTKAKENFLTQWAKDPSIPQRMLLLVAKKAEKQDTVQSVLSRSDMAHDNRERDYVFAVLINNTHVTDTILLHRMAKEIVKTPYITVMKNQFLRHLLQHKYDHLNHETLQIITVKAMLLNEEELRRIIAHPAVTLTILQIIAKKTKEHDTITAILTHPLMEKTGPQRTAVLDALLDNSHVTDTTLLQQIAERIVLDSEKKPLLKKLLKNKEKQLNTEALLLVAEHATLDENELLLLAKHDNANDVILNIVALQTKRCDTAHAVLDRSNIRTEKGVIDPLWVLIIDNKDLIESKLLGRVITEITERVVNDDTNNLLIALLRRKTEHLDTESLMLITQHARLTQREYALLAAHDNANTAVLTTIAQKVTKSRDFVTLLARNDLKQPQPNNDSIWKALIDNPLFKTPNLIYKTLVRAYQKEDLAKRTLHKKRDYLNSKTITMIVTKTILNEDERRIIAAHANTSKKTLITLATQSTTKESLQAILDREDVKTPSLMNDKVFKTIIDNPHVTDATLIHNLTVAIQNSTHQESLLKELFHQKWRRMTTQTLDLLINECTLKTLLTDELSSEILMHLVTNATLDDSALTLIIAHPNTTPDLLILIAAKIQKATTIDDLLAHSALRNDKDAKTRILQALIDNSALSQTDLTTHSVYKAHTDVIETQLKRLKNTQFFDKDTELDRYINEIKTKIPNIRSLTELGIIAENIKKQCRIMYSELTPLCNTLSQLEHGTTKEKYQATQMQKTLAKMPIKERTAFKITKPTEPPQGYKPTLPETDSFYFKRLALLPLRLQRKIDWTHLHDTCLKENNIDKTTRFALAEAAYLLNHLMAKTKALSKGNPFTALKSAYDALTEQYQDDSASPNLGQCIKKVKDEINKAKQDPLAQQHRGLKKILVGLASIAEYLQKTWWWITRQQKQSSDRLFFNPKNIQTKSQELLGKATKTITELDDIVTTTAKPS